MVLDKQGNTRGVDNGKKISMFNFCGMQCLVFIISNSNKPEELQTIEIRAHIGKEYRRSYEYCDIIIKWYE